jgi:hypothetical protein
LFSGSLLAKGREGWLAAECERVRFRVFCFSFPPGCSSPGQFFGLPPVSIFSPPSFTVAWFFYRRSVAWPKSYWSLNKENQ